MSGINNQMKFESRKARREAKKSKDQGIIELEKYELKDSKFMGTNKMGQYYEEYVAESMGRYLKLKERRRNLWAVLMPAGHGKTWLAQKYGLVDVDELITLEEHEKYVAMRVAILNGIDTWSGHNEQWFSRMNQTLDLFDYSRPVILLCHHEEIAHELGASVLGSILLDEKTFEANIAGRTELSKKFSRNSYKSFKLSRFSNQNLLHSKSNDDTEKFFLALMNLNNLPVAAPYKYLRIHKNYHYASDVPDWILTGEKAGDEDVDLKYLVNLHDRGKIPKEAVDYYVRESHLVTSFDFGAGMWEWTKELARLPPVMNEVREFDKDGDFGTIFPPRGPKEMTRANVTIRRLVQTFNIFQHEDAVGIAGAHVGEPHIFVASLLSAWKGLVQFTSVSGLVLPWFKVHSMHWTSRMKDLHSLVRTNRYFMNTEISEKDRQSLMYMDLLIGRAEYTVNEMSEIQKRGGETYETKHLAYDPELKRFTNRQYKTDFAQSVKQAYSRMRLNPKRINVRSFAEFYERRKTWLTKGSLVYNNLEAKQKRWEGKILDHVNEIVLEAEGRHNKQSFFEVADLLDIVATTSAENFNRTKTMLKYEVGGKERTLLPGSLMHFLVFTYVLVLAEKQEQVGSVRLNAMSDDDIRYFDKKMGNGIYHALYDWADFNEQHSADEMSAVISELSDVVVGPTDYAMFVELISWSMYNMTLQDRDRRVHKLWRGLYSGWRGTSWTNTVLNFCYTYCGLLSMERIYGKSCLLMVDHGGDDIDLMFSDPTMMPKFIRVMEEMLFNANAWKQMVGERSEFFRNTISGCRVYASPMRALASFVAGDWEGSGRSTVKERVVSLLDQIAKMRRRGLNNEMANGFVMCSISHWCKIRDGDEWVNLPGYVMHGATECGGMGVPDINNEVWLLETAVPEIDADWFKLIVPDMKSSRDYVSVVARELDRFSITIRDREEMARKFAEDSFDVEKQVDYQQYKRLLDFKTSVTGKRKVVVAMEDDVLFEQFMEFRLDDEIYKKYAKASRYIEFAGQLEMQGKTLEKEEIVNLMSDGIVSSEAVEFQGDVYYRRLVPEFIALRITYYCREAINKKACSVEVAEDAFRILCYMSQRVFKHMM
ncbi:RNA-dependent RNA polymerase [Macrophomina phaseolina chrysovirus 1]|uniref:RNA-directed RNA polymerase n=1 Tax=Macrophomina phaseolina chrysovirus 1 TaxID=1708483 RepID=A0A0M3SUP2_9VIRU|nr:RNA-dependent RNA polymerase [Macrophomina phaseolina chrysovirus 1]ALD89090.1 RNA-dependent RNA polymerase [Macrophomina phaseolina chrysovirus 1]